ncbi:MAG: glycosyltransferase [Cyanobacteria bacterium J06634_6]
MKILHVIPSLSPQLGGPTLVALNLVYALRQMGADVEIATTNYGLDVPTGQRIDYTFDLQRNLSVPIWALPYTPPVLKEFLFSTPLTRWLWQNLSYYDVIDTHYLFSYAPTCAAAIAQKKGIPYTIRTMGQLSPWALAQSHHKKQLYTRLIQRKQLDQAAAIHVTAKGEADDVRRFGIFRTPTVHLPLGVSVPEPIPHAKQSLKEHYGIPTDSAVLLFLSRLHPKKRPELLLQSIAKLKARGHQCHAVVAGTGEADYTAELKEFVASAGISQQVTFAGFVQGDQKDLLLQGSDLFVLPSYSENFGIAVAEALAAALPVVISPGIQIAPEIAAADAGCVVPDQLPLLVDKIASLLRSPARRKTMGERGQRFAQERYSWQAITIELFRVYRKLVNGSPLNQKLMPTETQLESSHQPLIK